ncbi:Leucine Rich Repeat [Seminavis robusta]|uniref:Leucine Rich Repeat n=1 Tax=Seminavis robusta TaxID=568900 RepID=A0A9N8EES2_9STRA|nr:Leucine Rich Repeat [Seminavis robusta]|eukprot:Sro970_g226320.1 Leucine Rich Repeat (786) ;mRNA; f:14485-16954
MKSSGRTTTSDEFEAAEREANNEEESFDVLDVVNTRIPGFTEEELRKMESFSERGGEEALAQGVPPSATSKEEEKEQESKKVKAEVQGTLDDNTFLLKVLTERQAEELPLRQAMNVAASTDNFDLENPHAPPPTDLAHHEKVDTRTTNPNHEGAGADLLDPQALPRTSLTRDEEVARRITSTPGAYSVAPGFELPTTAATYGMLAGHPVAGIETNSSLPSEVVAQERSLGNSGLAVANPVDETFHQDLPQAQEFETQESTRDSTDKKCKPPLPLGAIALVAVMIIIVAIMVPRKKDDGVAPMTAVPTSTPSAAPPMSLDGTIKALLEEETLVALADPGSPQFRAFEWLLEDPNLPSYLDAHLRQKFALVSLYYATSGDTWKDNTSWLDHSIDECEWYNAPDFAQKALMDSLYHGHMSGFPPSTEPPPPRCNEDGLYQHLWLDKNTLVGNLPEELYMLTSLQTLSLGYNQLEGSLGSRIGQLADLEGLAIYDQPPGGIPSEIGLLSKLRGLLLANSNHQGPLPSELWQLTNLEHFVLFDHQQMQGTISTEVGMLSKLKWFAIDISDVSGTIPTELGQIETLEWILLGRNMLSGSIPSELGFYTSKQHIFLDGNDLVGTIPSELGLLTSLFRLSFWDNHITGTVPSELCLLKNLDLALDLGVNLLTGIMPTELGLLTDLHDLLLDHNQLSGQIPSEFGELASLRITNLANNSLSGSVPVELSSLQQTLHSLLLDGNPMMTGTIPEPLCHLNGTCVIPAGFAHSCAGRMGVFFGCTDLLCGCDCSCGA